MVNPQPALPGSVAIRAQPQDICAGSGEPDILRGHTSTESPAKGHNPDSTRLLLGTPESVRKAQDALRAAREAGAHYRRDFPTEDQARWAELAKERGIALPQWHQPATPRKIRSQIHKLGLTQAQFLAWSGHRKIEDWARLNPTWGLRPLVGLILEALDENWITWKDQGDNNLSATTEVAS